MQKLRGLSFFSIMCCLGSNSLSAQDYPQATEAMREYIEETGDMRICQNGESPVILVEGRRVQVCRRQTLQDVENMLRLFQSVTPPREAREVAASRKLCVALVEREDFSAAREHCMKASKAGDSSSSFLLGAMAQSLEEDGSALEFYSLASDQGSDEASLLAGLLHAENGNWPRATLHLGRCYQSSVNGDSYNPNPYSPASKTKFECTNAVLKLILADKLEVGPFYEKVAMVPASIRGEIPLETYKLHVAGYRWYQGNWDAYKGIKLSGLRGTGRIDYRLWMVKDKPIVCQFRTGKGKLLEGDAEAAMCRHFQVNYQYNPALSADGNPVSSILEGSIEIDFPRTQ